MVVHLVSEHYTFVMCGQCSVSSWHFLSVSWKLPWALKSITCVYIFPNVFVDCTDDLTSVVLKFLPSAEMLTTNGEAAHCSDVSCSLPGKRRYDRKQSGYGGQTKPIFRKKVTFNPMMTDSELVTKSCVTGDLLPHTSFIFVRRPRPQRRLCWGWSVWSPTADQSVCWPSRDASTLSWEVTRRER